MFGDDEAQELCCQLYRKVRKKVGTLRALFEKVLCSVEFIVWEDWESLYERLAWKDGDPPPLRPGKMIYGC